MIQSSYTLAEIPQDLTATSGQVHAADVHAIAGSKKRKRSEIALAIDHQGVNIYDVQTSKIVTSYAISPQTKFTCAPCSIRYRRQGDKAPRRFTYCSVTSPKPQLVCFSEYSGTKSSIGHSIKTTSICLSNISNPVIYVDTFQVSAEKDGDALENRTVAVHEDGMVACYSKDLAAEEWSADIYKASPNGDLATSTYVSYAATLSVGQARKTILRGREDILAKLGTGSDHIGVDLLLVIIRSKESESAVEHGNLILKIFATKAAKAGTRMISESARQDIQELVSQVIPESHQLQTKPSKFTFNASYGKLYQHSERTLATYELTGSIPRLEHCQYLPKVISSCLQVSPNLLAFATPNSVSMVDLPYYSLQAEYKFNNVGEWPSISQTPDKQKNQSVKGENMSLLSYYEPSDIIVALEGRKLLAIQLSTTTLQTGGSRKRKRGGLLVNALGRGSPLEKGAPSEQATSHVKIKQLGRRLPSHATDREWSAQKAEIDRYSSPPELPNFEKIAASVLGTDFNEGHGQTLQPAGSAIVDLHILHYLLSRMFSVDKLDKTKQQEASSEPPRRIVMRFLPHRICTWLIAGGLLTAHHVERSLKHHGTLPFTAKLSDSALICALAESDVSLELISSLLASPTPLNARELVHILAIVTQGTERLDQQKNRKLLTIGELASRSSSSSSINSPMMQLTNGETPEAPSPPSQENAKEETYHQILNLTQRRLYACSSSSVARALQTQLSRTQLRLLIDTLRMQTAKNGWLSPYDDSSETLNPEPPNSTQLRHIAHLLNCAIDSIGTGGWILGTSLSGDAHESAATLSYLRAEISAALEGIEEATYLKGILGEMLLCGKSALGAAGGEPVNDGGSPVAPVAVRPTTVALGEGNGNVLPLGLKSGPVVAMARVGAGGELTRRSARDVGQLKSRVVGKYSFERIVI